MYILTYNPRLAAATDVWAFPDFELKMRKGPVGLNS